MPMAASAGVMASPTRGGNGNQPDRQPQIQTLQSPMKKAFIFVEIEGKVVGKHRLNKPLITVGRLAGNDVRVLNQRVSRLHARIRYENNTWVIEDAESINGIVYQGVRVERLALSNGDKIYIAPTAMLRYQTS